jgi:hypothetical protein
MELDQIRLKLAAETDLLWWSWRFLSSMDQAQPGKPEDLSQAAECFLTLALADVDWAMDRLSSSDPESHLLTQILEPPRLELVLSRLKLDDQTREALVHARILSAVAFWKLQDVAGAEPLWRRAWAELQRVPVDARDEEWRQIAIGPAAVADYPTYRELAASRLAAGMEDFDRSMLLPTALNAAFLHRDWVTFDSWLSMYRALPGPLVRGHSRCAVLSLEGLRALDEGRVKDSEQAMQSLLELSVGEPFLSNDDVAGFPKRMRAERVRLDLCDAFDALVKKNDWRRLGEE